MSDPRPEHVAGDGAWRRGARPNMSPHSRSRLMVMAVAFSLKCTLEKEGVYTDFTSLEPKKKTLFRRRRPAPVVLKLLDRAIRFERSLPRSRRPSTEPNHVQ